MTKLEYWILESVIEIKYPLHILKSEDRGVHFNKTDLILSINELSELMHGMSINGDICMQRMENGVINDDCLDLTVDLIRRCINEDNSIFYSITPDGGKKWEEVSMPIWDNYVDDWIDYASRCGEIYSKSPDLIRDIAVVQSNLNNFLVAEEEWDVISPWRATYWKTINECHRMRFKFRDRGSVNNLTEEENLRWLKWYTEKIKWYDVPYL